MSEKVRTLGELEKELHTRMVELDRASRAANMARSVETAARNDVNETHKAIDDAVAKLRTEAPRDTDWKLTKGLPS